MREWWIPRKPDEVAAQPYLHPAVAGYLESLLHTSYSVLEHGSGGSTLWLSKYVNRVVSVENDPVWYTKVKELVSDNVTIFLQVFSSIPKGVVGPFDLMLIDGNPVENRGMYLNEAINLVRKGGIVILDNANRPEYAVERRALQRKCKHFITLDVNPPGHNYCVTEFYRLPGGTNAESWI